MSFISRILAAISAAMAGIRGAFAFAWDAIEEAAEPVTRRLPWFRDRVRDAGHASAIGASYAVQGAGLALQAPGAVLREVGSILGSVLPSPAATPQGVAAGAVAMDDARQPVQAAPRRYVDVSSERYGRKEDDAVEVQLWAKAMRKRDRSLVKQSEGIAPQVFAWLSSCTPEQLLRIEQLPASRVLAHLLPERDSDMSQLLPPAVGIERLDAGPDANEIMHRLGLSDEERRKYLPAGEFKASRRPAAAAEQDNEEAYLGPVPVFGR